VIPTTFEQRIVTIYGDRGRAWLAKLLSLLDELALAWDVEIDAPFGGLTFNYVAPTRDGKYVVKIGIGTPEGSREAVALMEYGGEGAVPVVRQDSDRRAMLLERISPGIMLTEVPDEEATVIAADVLAKLWRPTSGDFPGLAEWTQALEKIAAQPHPLPANILERAVRQRRELLETAPESVLLHGDLHHYNILRSEEKGWLAIDPKGVIGERAYDIVAYLLNPRRMTPAETAKRIEIFSERLGLDSERVRAWAFVQSMVSACWTVEDGEEGWEGAVQFAEEF